jgi:hypothetical protein
MFTGLIIASINTFNSKEAKADKNGLAPVILNIVAGKCPNRNVISGTIADSMGIEVGHTYLLSVTEGNEDPQYGRQFVYNKLKEVSAMEIVQAAREMDKAEIFQLEAVTATTKAEFGK